MRPPKPSNKRIAAARKSNDGRGSDSRERICQVAAELFESKGFHATTMDDVAAGVSLNKATIYHHFDSKSDILFEIYDRAAQNALEGIRRLNGDIPADTALAELIRYQVNAISMEPHLVGVYFQEMRWLPQWLSRDQLMAIRRKEDEYTNFVVALIERGIAEGSFQVNDARTATYALVGMIGWTRQWLPPRRKVTPDEVADRLIQLIFDGLASRPFDTRRHNRRSGSQSKP
jgi:AcrR family transcriptional regulator